MAPLSPFGRFDVPEGHFWVIAGRFAVDLDRYLFSGGHSALGTTVSVSPSFNGAVHRSARKAGFPKLARGRDWLLQRSRAPECTESMAQSDKEENLLEASTEPCTGVHGKRLAHLLCPRWQGHRFNGAVHRSARKATCSPYARLSALYASTEPCTGVHGKPPCPALASRAN